MNKFTKAVTAVILAVSLAACGPSAPPAPLDPATAAAQQSQGMSPVTAGLLGAAAGFFMGRSSSTPAAPAYTAPARQTIIVNKTVTVNRPAPTPPKVVPRTNFNSPGPKVSYGASRSSSTFRSGRR